MSGKRWTLVVGAVVVLIIAVWIRGRGVEDAEAQAAVLARASLAEPVAPPAEAMAEATPNPMADLGSPAPGQLEDYAAHRPKSVLELQPFRVSQQVAIEDLAGRAGTATLIHLNPRINDWFVLGLEWVGEPRMAFYHLENADRRQRVALRSGYLSGLQTSSGGRPQACDLWGGEAPRALAAAVESGLPFAPLCDGRLTLRNRVEGRKTRLEWTTDFLRDNVWKGEQLTVLVRTTLYQDAFLATSEITTADAAAAARPRPSGAPRRPLVDPRFEASYLTPAELGLSLEYEVPGQVLVGRWYPVRQAPGIFVSAIRPNLVSKELIAGLQGRLNPLDEIESSALVYMVAFDLEQFEVGFAVGTEHPRVGWSERTPVAMRDASLPGPDGIGSIEPLVATGMVRPADRARIAATFTGGFKRSHGAFRAGELAQRNAASHYGFIERGAILSKLQPGLATALVYDDGAVELKTWGTADDADLPRLRHARQNGVPMIELDPATGQSWPGTLVPQWALGNWSGSVDQRLRTLRAGLCLQESGESRFLIYGYFSTATPSAMARVFQAYHCRYAMLTDMNALEHTYLAVYRQTDGSFEHEHLIDEMKVLDRFEGGQQIPRFVGFPDNRDFFYLSRKRSPRG